MIQLRIVQHLTETIHMLTNSRDIIRRLIDDDAQLKRITGSHHHYFSPKTQKIVTVPHPRKDLPLGTVRSIYKQAGWDKD